MKFTLNWTLAYILLITLLRLTLMLSSRVHSDFFFHVFWPHICTNMSRHNARLTFTTPNYPLPPRICHQQLLVKLHTAAQLLYSARFFLSRHLPGHCLHSHAILPSGSVPESHDYLQAKIRHCLPANFWARWQNREKATNGFVVSFCLSIRLRETAPAPTGQTLMTIRISAFLENLSRKIQVSLKIWQ